MKNLVVTRGADGVSFIEKDSQLDIPVEGTVAITSVIGAGDSFMGGYLFALSKGLNKTQ